MTRHVLRLVLLSTVLLFPVACGKKGPPVLSPGEHDDFPRHYPSSTDPQRGVFN
ncbi:MAG TPA: hypothetical protein VHL08_00420 [Dongiaceae bacterium]|nr:hypothetical protein [Dongiaceae bacterium]